LRVAFAARDDDRVQGAVELAVAAAVEAVAGDLARAGGDGRGAAVAGEGGLVVEATAVRPGDQELGGRDRTNARLASSCGASACTSSVISCLSSRSSALAARTRRAQARSESASPRSSWG
jgi:hypothetical protein